MTEFFRFPRTPHLAWLGDGSPRDDKVLPPSEVTALLAGEVVVEEKLDGANVGLSLTSDGHLRAQNRGQYLAEPHAGQFARLPTWLAQHSEGLRAVLTPSLILFGEWCAARHSLDYAALPDWFLLFDVYDRSAGRFWNSARRDALAATLQLSIVPRLLKGHCNLQQLKEMLSQQSSKFRQGAIEGVVIRRDSAEWCEARAKLVRPDFIQIISEHWSRRRIEWNQLDWAAT